MRREVGTTMSTCSSGDLAGWALTFLTQITTAVKLKSSCDGTVIVLPALGSLTLVVSLFSALAWSFVWWWKLSARTICGVLVVTHATTAVDARYVTHQTLLQSLSEGRWWTAGVVVGVGCYGCGGGGAGCRLFFFVMCCDCCAAPVPRFDPRFSSHSLASVRSVASATE